MRCVSATLTVVSLLLCLSIQDITTLFNLLIILLMLFNTYLFQVGLVAILLTRFRTPLMLSALYLTSSIALHSWLMVLWLRHRYVLEKQKQPSLRDSRFLRDPPESALAEHQQIYLDRRAPAAVYLPKNR